MLRLLLIEDSELDEKILIRHLNKSLLPFSYVTVDTRQELVRQLQNAEWDIIISDYNLSDFTGIDVIEIVKTTRKDIPIIIVSGNIGEQTAVEAMHAGADDYLMKDNLTRLAPAIERAIRQAEYRRQKRLADEEISEAKVQLEAFFNSSIQGIYLIDSAYRIQRFNTVALNSTMYLMGREPQIGESIMNYFPDELHSAFKQNILRCLQGEIVTDERLMSLSKMKDRWYQVRYSPVYIENANTTRIAISILDITKRVTAELESKELHLRLEGIINSAMDAIITTGDQQRIVMVNEAAEKMFGYKALQLLDHPISLLIPDRFRNRHYEDVQHFSQTGITTRVMGVGQDVLYGLHSSGKEFPIEASISQVEIGKKRYYTVIIRDITLRMEAQEQERKLNQELIQQNEQLRQFGYITSHNIRGPVATLLGLMQLLEEDNSEITNTEVIQYMTLTLSRLDTVIKDLNSILEYHKPVSLIRESVLLNDLCHDVCGLILPLLKEADCILDVDFSAVPELHSVRSYLHSIFYNLITNAVKFKNPERQLRLSIRSSVDKHSVVIEFKDNGLGIDLKKYQESLFGMHKRFHLEIEGKGLGLYLVKTQVTALNGRIDVTSEVGQGTVFRLWLPNA